MQPITIFSLEQHAGEYASWPLKTQLLVHGQACGLSVPCFTLLHQYALANNEYLLVADWDCPFEEQTEFLLISGASPTQNQATEFKLLARRSLGGAYVSYLLDDIEILASDRLKITFYEQDYWRLVIRAKRGFPYFLPRLSLRPIKA